MTRRNEPVSHEQLEAYLDGQLSPSEREAFEALLRDHPQMMGQIELQSRIDVSLIRQFELRPVPEEHIEEILAAQAPRGQTESAGSVKARAPRRPFRITLLAAVAAVAWMIASWHVDKRPPVQPFFQPAFLSEIYRETIASGFRPYYECRDADRFAATFSQRQGQPLRLTQLPKGRRMLGLSYPGGLSRYTTAMLCMVDDEPVMVFVDRLDADHPLAIRNNDPGIHVVRKEYHGLVIYEVTPFKSGRILNALRVTKAKPPK